MMFNSLGPSGAIWRHMSALVEAMACCLTAPSHYLNQCWTIISKVQWHSSECYFTRDTSTSVTKIILKITYLKFKLNLPVANEFTLPPVPLGPKKNVRHNTITMHKSVVMFFYIPLSFRHTSHVQGQQYDCPDSSETTIQVNTSR